MRSLRGVSRGQPEHHHTQFRNILRLLDLHRSSGIKSAPALAENTRTKKGSCMVIMLSMQVIMEFGKYRNASCKGVLPSLLTPLSKRFHFSRCGDCLHRLPAEVGTRILRTLGALLHCKSRNFVGLTAGLGHRRQEVEASRSLDGNDLQRADQL